MKKILITKDRESLTGLRFSQECLNNLKSQIQEAINSRRLIGQLNREHKIDNGLIDIKKVSHIVDKLEIDSDGAWIINVDILQTPQGKILNEIVDDVVFTVFGTGRINTDGQVEEYDLISIDAIL